MIVKFSYIEHGQLILSWKFILTSFHQLKIDFEGGRQVVLQTTYLLNDTVKRVRFDLSFGISKVDCQI